ncbi:MAG TPA: MBL fold metallo-hydrolase [Verrucomicrobiae bacterium]|nr:MBL fold metallo-hydrolase [Verrucomicrobiae bacterium]
MSPVIVITLGTGDAFGSGGRAHSGILIQASGRRLLIDPGPCILPQLQKAGISAGNIDSVLITHLHGDHIAGLPFLLLDCEFSSKRKRPLLVTGPRGSAKRLQALVNSCYPELSPKKRSFALTYQQVAANNEFMLAGTRVTAFSMNHNQSGICLGYRLQAGKKVVSVTGDTGWCDSIVTLADGADLLLIECTNYSTETAGHLSYRDIAHHRHELRSRRIVLTHVGEELLRNSGRVRLPIARDGGRIIV